MSVMIIFCISSDGFGTLVNTEVYLGTEKRREVGQWVEGSPFISQCAESKIPGPLRSQFMDLSDVASRSHTL